MPPPSNSPALALTLLPDPFFVLQIDKPSDVLLAALAAPVSAHQFLSITRTHEEISVVGSAGASHAVPQDAQAKWRCIKVSGPMDFGLTGIMSALTFPLAQAGVPIFAVSTWNTDYVLVGIDKADDAMRVLENDGWTVTKSV